MNNLLHFPVSGVSQQEDASNPPSISNRIKLFDGKLVLYKRPDSAKDNWHYAIILPQGAERKSTKTSDLTRAQKIATDRFQHLSWRVAQGYGMSQTTFATAAQALLIEVKRRKKLGGKHSNAKLNSELIKRHLIPYFGKLSLADIKQADIDAYHKHYLEHRIEAHRANAFLRKPTAGSMRYHEQLILQVIDLAVAQGSISAAERPTIKLTPAKVRVRGGFEPNEYDKIIQLLDHRVAQAIPRCRNIRRQALLYVKFLRETGMRPGVEPCSVRFCDVQDNRSTAKPHGVIQVRDGKRGPRKVLVKPIVLDIIDEIRATHDAPTKETSLFKLSDDDHGVRFIATFRQVLKELGMTTDATGAPRTLYSLRHTAITSMIAKGSSLSFIAKNYGTSVDQIQITYDHVIHTTQIDELR